MSKQIRKTPFAFLALLAVGISAMAAAPPPPPPPPPPNSGTGLPPLAFANPSGVVQTYFAGGTIDRGNPFFLSLGTNGRTCETCHQAASGWSISPLGVQALFNQTQGLAPIFRTNDGAVSPKADVSTVQARQAAYGLLLNRGLIRVGLGVPANAEFGLAAVDDPYGYASAAQLSLFRRPLPATNLGFLSSVMWDGRENLAGQPIAASLARQANTATIDHAQASQALTDAQRQQIVAFETALYTAQISDNQAGGLDQDGALGGPLPLFSQVFYPGINDPAGPVFNLFNAWQNGGGNATAAQQNARASILRGQRLFNARTFAVREVAGVNIPFDAPPATMTCGTCHNAPNAGSQSVRKFVNTGTANPPNRVPELPLYTLRNLATGATTQTSDPGRALVSGRWQDIGRFKVPTLRGLAARAPFFHNGSAPTLEAVVGFYNRRFSIGLSAGEQADLANFLKSL